MQKILRTTGLIGALLCLPSVALAQSDTGTLTVTATVESSIALTFENASGGVTLSGATTDTATMAFGNVSAYGTITTAGVTRTAGATNFTVSSPFAVKVVLANGSSADYTLQAALTSADTTNTWEVNSTTLTTTDQTLGSSYAYGSALPHTLSLTVPFSATASSVSNVVTFTATPN